MYPEVESAIYEIPPIKKYAFGVPDDKWGSWKGCNILWGQSITKEEIIKILRNKLAGYKIPKYIQFIDDIPKNNVGKIVVSKIMELYGECRD